MKLNRIQLRRLILEAIDMQAEVDKFVGNLEVIGLDAVGNPEDDTSPTGDEIVVKVPLTSNDSNGSLASVAANFYVQKFGYVIARGHNKLIVDPITPKTGYFKYRKK